MDQPPESSDVLAQINAQRLAGFRATLLVWGKQPETVQFAHRLIKAMPRPRVLGVPAYQGTSADVSTTSPSDIIGQEFDVALFDAWRGFDPDVFGAVCGALRGGGLLIICAPPLEAWSGFKDPFQQRITPAGANYPELSRFITRFTRQLERPGVFCFDAAAWLQKPAQLRFEPVSFRSGSSEDQQRGIETVANVMSGQRRRPAVLTGDRGRGKSAALGLAAARLMQQRHIRIAVTGISLDACRVIFRHCAAELGLDSETAPGRLLRNESALEFVETEGLLERLSQFDMVLVDEAAALPMHFLQRLLQLHSRLAFATTTHGYEGSGRGFAVVFGQMLRHHSRGARAVQLHSPARWSVGDPLEKLAYEFLLLDAASDPAPPELNPEFQVREVSADELMRDESLLRQVYGLLVQAHYRTRPFDLRQLLDSDSLRIEVAWADGAVVGVLVGSREGLLEPAAAAAIVRGERRPRGHLLVETLAAHLGESEAAALSVLRIMRIAVAPGWRRRGIGSRLVRFLNEESQQDLIGTVFSLSPGVCEFWQGLGFRPVRLGLRRQRTSAGHSLTLIMPGNPRSQALVARASEVFQRAFPIRLAGPFRDLPAADGVAVLRLFRGPEVALGLEALCEYAHSHRSLESVFMTLWRLLPELIRREILRGQDAQLLLCRVLQQRSDSTCAELFSLSGRAEVDRRMRTILGSALSTGG